MIIAMDDGSGAASPGPVINIKGRIAAQHAAENGVAKRGSGMTNSLVEWSPPCAFNAAGQAGVPPA